MAHNEELIDNFHIGQDATLTIEVTDENGDPASIVGGDVEFYLIPHNHRERSIEDADILLEKSLGNGLNLIEGENNKVEVTFVPEDTRDLASGTKWYRVVTTDSDGKTVPGSVSGPFGLDY